MKYIKTYEINLPEISDDIKMLNTITNHIVESFMIDCEHFTSEDSRYEDDILVMYFFFPFIEEKEMEIILECRNYLNDFLYGFYLQPNNRKMYAGEEIKLTIKINKVEELYEKILLEKNAEIYNL